MGLAFSFSAAGRSASTGFTTGAASSCAGAGGASDAALGGAIWTTSVTKDSWPRVVRRHAQVFLCEFFSAGGTTISSLGRLKATGKLSQYHRQDKVMDEHVVVGRVGRHSAAQTSFHSFTHTRGPTHSHATLTLTSH